MDYTQLHYFGSSFVTIITGYSLYKVINNQWAIYQNRRLINIVRQTPLTTNFDEFKGKQVVVKGQVQSNKKNSKYQPIIKRVNKKDEQFILYFQYREPIFSNDDFSDRDNYCIRLKETLSKGLLDINENFCLVGDKTKPNLLVRKYAQNMSFERALEITRWENMKRRLNLTEKVQTLIYSYFRSVGALAFRDNRSTLIKGLNIGHREVESGIKVGTSLMALGTIGMTAEGQFFIEPQALFKDRLSFIGHYQDIIEALQQQRNVWGIISIIGLIYISRRAYNYNKKHKTIDKIKKEIKRMLKK